MDLLHYLQTDYQFSIAGRLLLAAFLGGLIGLEREIHGRPAGFRTHVLVTVGACLMTIVSEYFQIKYGSLDGTQALRVDPGRVAAQVVAGIGFLGAGAIIKEKHAIRGLTTAACLWVAAGIGMSVAVGLYSAALVVTAISLFSLLFLKRLERHLKKDRYRTLLIVSPDTPGTREKIERFLDDWGLHVVDFGLERDADADEIRYEYIVSQCGDKVVGALSEAVSHIPGVKKVRFY